MFSETISLNCACQFGAETGPLKTIHGGGKRQGGEVSLNMKAQKTNVRPCPMCLLFTVSFDSAQASEPLTDFFSPARLP